MHRTHFLESASVVETREIAERTFLTKFFSPQIASLVRAGQFVMVSFPGSLDPLLPRAFSVCDVELDRISLLYVAVGKGTSRLSKLRSGESVVMNGPLGNGFPELVGGEKVWFAVGGSGAAILPILVVGAKKSGSSFRIFYGAKTNGQLIRFDYDSISYATDDGSTGYHGTVVELIKHELLEEKPDKIFACGPTPMLVNMQKEMNGRVPTYLSVETPMACGIGLCQGCPVKKNDGADYFLACKDGPVFDARKVELVKGNSAR